jgi:hypothetical protein
VILLTVDVAVAVGGEEANRPGIESQEPEWGCVCTGKANGEEFIPIDLVWFLEHRVVTHLPGLSFLFVFGASQVLGSQLVLVLLQLAVDFSTKLGVVDFSQALATLVSV